MDSERREESDQLPEEAPPGQARDDDSGEGARDDATDSPGAADDDSAGDESTGNPDAAG